MKKAYLVTFFLLVSIAGLVLMLKPLIIRKIVQEGATAELDNISLSGNGTDRIREEWIKVRLTIGVKYSYPNGSIYRPIHGYVEGGEWDNKIVNAWNITVTVEFPYENATYRGYTEETYFVAEKIESRGDGSGCCMWEVTDIDGQYIGAKSYGWIKVWNK